MRTKRTNMVSGSWLGKATSYLFLSAFKYARGPTRSWLSWQLLEARLSRINQAVSNQLAPTLVVGCLPKTKERELKLGVREPSNFGVHARARPPNSGGIPCEFHTDLHNALAPVKERLLVFSMDAHIFAYFMFEGEQINRSIKKAWSSRQFVYCQIPAGDLNHRPKMSARPPAPS